MKHVSYNPRPKRTDSMFADRFARPRRLTERPGIPCVRCAKRIGYWEPMHLVDGGWSCHDCMTAAELADMTTDHNNLVGD